MRGHCLAPVPAQRAGRELPAPTAAPSPGTFAVIRTGGRAGMPDGIRERTPAPATVGTGRRKATTRRLMA